MHGLSQVPKDNRINWSGRDLVHKHRSVSAAVCQIWLCSEFQILSELLFSCWYVFRWITCCPRGHLSVTCRRHCFVTSHWEFARNHICCSMHGSNSWMQSNLVMMRLVFTLCFAYFVNFNLCRCDNDLSTRHTVGFGMSSRQYLGCDRCDVANIHTSA